MGELVFDDLETRRAEIERHRENSARLAKTYARFRTTGQGTIQIDRRVDFGLTFIEKPYLTTGCEVNLDEYSELLNIDDSDPVPPLPMSTVYVTDWDQDDRGYYTGCWVAISVYPSPLAIAGNAADVAGSAVDPAYQEALLELAGAQIEIQHHLTFEAIAMKDIPEDLG